MIRLSHRWVFAAGLVALPALLAGCGGGGSGNMVGVAGLSGQQLAVASGVAAKGPLAGAQMGFFSVTAAGRRGSLLARTQADEEGRFSTPLAMSAAGPVWVECLVSRHRDEATEQMVSLPASRMVTFCIAEVRPGTTVEAPLTPFNHMAFRAAMAGGGVSTGRMRAALDSLSSAVGADVGMRMPQVMANRATVRAAFGSAGFDTRRDAAMFGMALAGMSRRAQELGMDSVDYMLSLGRDYEDGRLDGVAPGQRVLGGLSAREMDSIRSATETFARERAADEQAPPEGTARMLDTVTAMRNRLEPMLDIDSMPRLERMPGGAGGMPEGMGPGMGGGGMGTGGGMMGSGGSMASATGPMPMSTHEMMMPDDSTHPMDMTTVGMGPMHAMTMPMDSMHPVTGPNRMVPRDMMPMAGGSMMRMTPEQMEQHHAEVIPGSTAPPAGQVGSGEPVPPAPDEHNH